MMAKLHAINKQLYNITKLPKQHIINASKINADYNIQETGALWRLDSNNICDFPIIQICTNINKQHLNFLKRKTLDGVIREDVGYLSNFTNIYIGKQINILYTYVYIYIHTSASARSRIGGGSTDEPFMRQRLHICYITYYVMLYYIIL